MTLFGFSTENVLVGNLFVIASPLFETVRFATAMYILNLLFVTSIITSLMKRFRFRDLVNSSSEYAAVIENGRK